jgi:tetratricopeptide (TPR) repeat protein
MAIERGETFFVGTGYVNLGDVVWMNEGPEAGLKVHREGVEYCRRRGSVQMAMWAMAETTWMLFDSGEWDEVIRATDEVGAWVERGGINQTDALALPFKAMVLLSRGDVAGSGRLLQDLLPRARRFADPQILVPTLTAAALWERTASNSERALGLVNEFVEVSRGPPVYVCWMITNATRIYVENGDLAAANRLIESSRPTLKRELNAVAAANAIIAEAESRLDDALGLYLDAGDRWSRFPFPLEQGYALAGAGRCLRALGREEEARSHLEQARSIFGSLGALPLVADVDAHSR